MLQTRQTHRPVVERDLANINATFLKVPHFRDMRATLFLSCNGHHMNTFSQINITEHPTDRYEILIKIFCRKPFDGRLHNCSGLV